VKYKLIPVFCKHKFYVQFPSNVQVHLVLTETNIYPNIWWH